MDSIIFRAYQGDEEDLEQRMMEYLNSEPKKDIKNILTWTIGIEVYIMILYELATPIIGDVNA